MADTNAALSDLDLMQAMAFSRDYQFPQANYGPGLTLAGGGFGAGSRFTAGRDTATLLETNAAIAGMQRTGEVQAGSEQAEVYRQHLAQRMGLQAAAIGGSNVTTGGSAERGLETTAAIGAQDIARIQLNAARKAWGFQVTQAGDELRADMARRGGEFGGVGQLITTGARAYGQWNAGD